MDPITVGGIATGVGSLLSTLATNRANKKRQEEMNEYNSPAAQLERYKKAGVNPGYGQGLSAGNQSSFPAAQAPDVSAAIEPSSKFLAMKLQHQTLQNAQLENNRLAEIVKNQQLNNAILEQTLPDRVGLVKNQMHTAIMTLRNYLPAKIDKMTADASRAAIGTQSDELKLRYLQPALRLSNSFRELQNILSQQKIDLNTVMNPMQYQLSQQQFNQREITNPLEAILLKMKSLGMQGTDPLLLRMIAPGVAGGGEFDSNPLLPYAVPFSFGKGMMDVFKSTKGLKLKK